MTRVAKLYFSKTWCLVSAVILANAAIVYLYFPILHNRATFMVFALGILELIMSYYIKKKDRIDLKVRQKNTSRYWVFWIACTLIWGLIAFYTSYRWNALGMEPISVFLMMLLWITFVVTMYRENVTYRVHVLYHEYGLKDGFGEQDVIR